MKSDYWKNKNVFVTGATGFFGAWLCERLIKNKAKVITLMRDYVPESRLFRDDIISKITVVRGELEGYNAIERILNEYEIEIVFHLAAQAIVPIANNNPLSTYESNIRGTWLLLEGCRRNGGIKKIIVTSSDKAYGEHKKLPYVEDMALCGKNPYDVSKSCADLIAQMYFQHYNLPVCITRYGNLFGGGDLNFSRIIPGAIKSVYYNERPVIRSNGKYMRDYFYVKDAVNAIISLAEKMDNHRIMGQAFNFSNGKKYSVIEVVNEIFNLMNKRKLKPIILNKAKGEIINQYLSSEKARKLLKWAPVYDLRSGMAETVEWYTNYFKSIE
ncbi:MAG: NAD-dependent epimerase/dehydratase family protein [bacterium]